MHTANNVHDGIKRSWNIEASDVAKRTSNPIRAIVDQIQGANPNPEKEPISLAIGDHTKYGNFHVADSIVESVVKVVRSGKFNGYPHSCGYPEARKTIAVKYSTPTSQLTEEDVIIASGCSGALEILLGGIANEGDNILIPDPGFSLYQTICDSKGIKMKHYHLQPDKGWEVDLEEIRGLIDSRTRAVLINNPSNPCGSVYSRQHLQDIIDLCWELCVPIIADEIYGEMVFGDAKFYPMASLARDLPVFSVSGIAKQYVVPGWRLGWILVHDPAHLAREAWGGMIKLSQLVLGANSLVQGALQDILHHTSPDFYASINKTLEENAVYSVERISQISGLKIIAPQGAMYLMVGIDTAQFKDIEDDIDFSKKLNDEEFVVVLPGAAFRQRNYFRIVFCPPKDKLCEAYDRIARFCARHHI